MPLFERPLPGIKNAYAWKLHASQQSSDSFLEGHHSRKSKVGRRNFAEDLAVS